MCESASGCRLQSSYSTSIVFSSLKSNGHLAASCQFTQTGELASGCRLPVSYLAFVVLNPLKSNWHLAASCQFTQTGELASGCRFPVSYLAFIVLNPHKSKWHLAASCQLPIHTNRRISIWLPVTSCQFGRDSELTSGCRLPVSF